MDRHSIDDIYGAYYQTNLSARHRVLYAWCDEIRDMPEETFHVLLSRLRETEYIKTLWTTTTNGDSWDYKLFCLNRSKDNPMLFGSMHIPTIMMVEAGIITMDFYNGLLQTYSTLMADQELHAKHVNVHGGKAYYSAGERNKRRISPWGDRVPNTDRPLIVGCDFNYSPSPCLWMIGQTGPNHTDDVDGIPFWEKIHWFSEICINEASTPDMTQRLISRYPDFHYRVFGDASGNKGTTSNAGVYDYQQIAMEVEAAGGSCTIDWVHASPDEARGNPRVKSVLST